eukprot:GFUD01037931.1.p1 GENE.GFUD01037931.1~~GFUD01037931.1.p1  ORF type:complete len:507 (+),score=150.46 GFUD01037931.1:55-1575(+)
MDIVALACQEVGLDLTDHELTDAAVEEYSQDVWRDTTQAAWQDDTSQEGWQLQVAEMSKEGNRRLETRLAEVVMPKQLSFGVDLSNTVFTDQEGKESSVDLQFIRPSYGISPVTNLYSQKKSNAKISRRSRPSQMTASIQGAPCRNLPDLPSVNDLSKPVSRSEQYPVLEVPSPLTQPPPVQDHENNPFLHLFQDTRPGQVSFAYYVSDCWASFGGSSGVSDQDQFLKQCEGWWIHLPTPYRRGYWTREVEYYKNRTGQRTWPGQGEDGRVKVMVASRKNKHHMKTSHVSKEKDESQPSPPKKLMAAFKQFKTKYKSKVMAEMVGATGIEVRRELGKRWKSMSNEKKLQIVKMESDDKKDKKISVHSDKEVFKNEKFGVRADEEAINHANVDINDTCTEQVSEDISFNDASDSKLEDITTEDKESWGIINITLDEVDEFAIENKFYIEDEGLNSHQNPELEFSSPEKKVFELVSDLGKIEVVNTSFDKKTTSQCQEGRMTEAQWNN